jgi:hypothetical protein
MPGTTQSAPPKLIVVPRQLEDFFYERLTQRFEARTDVKVVVDRRAGERRHDRWVSGPGPFSERRRHHDRRDNEVLWSLPDMPFAAS